MPFEEGLEVRDAAVVDVFVRRGEVPVLRVGGKGSFHVLVDELLQIPAEGAVAADDLIRADAGIGRHVAPWVVELHISGVIADLLMGTVQRGMDEAGGEALVLRRMAASFFGKLAGIGMEVEPTARQDGCEAEKGAERLHEQLDELRCLSVSSW